MEIITKKLSELKPASYNPRYIADDALNGLTASMEEFGCVQPIIWNKRTDNIVGGHQRYKILKSQKAKETEVVMVDLSLEKEKALNLTLNNQNITGDFNAGLELILKDIKTSLPDLYDDLSLEKLLADIPEIPEPPTPPGDPDKVPEVTKEPVIKTGDVVRLGKHRLLCADSCKKEDVERVMGGEKADILYCDPPYGMRLDADFSGMVNKLEFAKNKNINSGKKYDNVIGDDQDFDPVPLIKLFDYCKEQFWWGADYYAERLPDKNKGSWVVWDKRLDDSADKMYGSCFELCWSRSNHKRDIARIKWAGVFGTEQEFDHKRYHPNQKPIGLSKWFLEQYSKETNIVFDGFLGSGSTLIACETTNRICRGLEISPAYVQVSTQRWIDFTGRPEDVTIERDGKEYGWEEIKTPHN